MMRIKKTFCLVSLMFMLPFSLFAGKPTKGKQVDWNPVMDAIIKVESKGNARAVNGPHVGVLQISPVLVAECNEILQRRGSKKRFTLKDRYCKVKSKEMFVIFQSAHNPKSSIEHGIRLWNGGIRYSIARTQRYLKKVMKHL